MCVCVSHVMARHFYSKSSPVKGKVGKISMGFVSAAGCGETPLEAKQQAAAGISQKILVSVHSSVLSRKTSTTSSTGMPASNNVLSEKTRLSSNLLLSAISFKNVWHSGKQVCVLGVMNKQHAKNYLSNSLTTIKEQIHDTRMKASRLRDTLGLLKEDSQLLNLEEAQHGIHTTLAALSHKPLPPDATDTVDRRLAAKIDKLKTISVDVVREDGGTTGNGGSGRLQRALTAVLTDNGFRQSLHPALSVHAALVDAWHVVYGGSTFGNNIQSAYTYNVLLGVYDTRNHGQPIGTLTCQGNTRTHQFKGDAETEEKTAFQQCAQTLLNKLVQSTIQ